MKKLIVFSLIFSCASALSASADSPDDVQLGQPAYAGSGCPSGSASVAISTDSKELSILFDQFVAEAGGTTGLSFDRKNCTIAIPVHVPQGWSVSIFEIDYRGFTAIPAGGRAQFNVEYFFAGATGPKYAKTWYGPSSDNYTLQNTLMASASVWSACGTDVILRTNTAMLAQTNSRKEQAMATVDSMDVKAGIKYLFQWKRCGSGWMNF